MKVIENKGGYVYVLYDEPYSKTGLIDLMKTAYEKCSESNCNLLLVNLIDMPGTISIMDRFELGVQGALIFKNQFKIAVVYRQEEINAFAETVGVNRGMNAQVFSKIDTAMSWLGVGGSEK